MATTITPMATNPSVREPSRAKRRSTFDDSLPALERTVMA